MGDSDLTVYLATAAMIDATTIMAAVAWRIPKRTVRVAIGSGLVVLGLWSAVLSFAAFVLVAGLGVAVLIIGIRTAPGGGRSARTTG